MGAFHATTVWWNKSMISTFLYRFKQFDISSFTINAERMSPLDFGFMWNCMPSPLDICVYMCYHIAISICPMEHLEYSFVECVHCNMLVLICIWSNIEPKFHKWLNNNQYRHKQIETSPRISCIGHAFNIFAWSDEWNQRDQQQQHHNN